MSDFELYLKILGVLGKWANEPQYEGVLGVLYDWQTTIAACVAFATGGLLVNQIRLQRIALDLQSEALKTEREKHADYMRRRELASRIRIPHSLNQISDFLDEAYKRWPTGSVEGLVIPHTALETLMQVSEAVDERTYRFVHALVCQAQVLMARYLSKSPPEPYDKHFIWDVARLNYFVNILYPYGRLRNDAVVDFKEPDPKELYRQTVSRWEFNRTSTSLPDTVDRLIEETDRAFNANLLFPSQDEGPEAF